MFPHHGHDKSNHRSFSRKVESILVQEHFAHCFAVLRARVRIEMINTMNGIHDWEVSDVLEP